MPRLTCTFAEVIAILEANGFILTRHDGTSHRQYRAVIGGKVHLVTIAGKPSDDVAIGTLQSIIRQSGLSKMLFRK
ncbi:type II toxin-antitoxin system HicA family toxin [Methylobacterium sp. EM32]|uniref:type II toxin-antitoxin system HicA family toxin n=1 Tax=unclassified Methylobacterium TaxID=2615210 RepID=UPI0008E9A0EE|nr:type II toxin-antitoxin system HicA family toxin [Methylobacterium sp. 174MFSha1.1]SFU90102.1 Predicted RNA binding protein YcfA, dsRBD-like fold, HicA-like mRNA interferase family [Methylobacterium sp. 174MFSha1.1]